MEQPDSQQAAPDGAPEAAPGSLEALASALSDAGDGTVSAATEAPLSCTAATQTEAAAVDAAALAAQLRAPALAAFLRRAGPRCEEALQQNELADPFLDALAALVDDEAGDAGAAAGSHPGAASSAAGLVEHQSFSDLLRSKGRSLAAACFHPTRRGVVAVAVAGSGDAPPPASRQPASGMPSSLAPNEAQPGCILLWSHGDAIHPEAVLQAPAEVTALAWHPAQQHVLAAGLSTGQVALFHLQQKAGSTGSGAAAALPTGRTVAAGPGGQAADGGQEGSRNTAELLPLHLSMPEASHHAAVADLYWLPGMALSRDGRMETVAQRSEGGSAAGPADAADGCTLFATTAADGALLVWDMHISARHRKHAGKEEEQPDWKPALALAAAGAAKQPLLATRFYVDTCSSSTTATPGRFVVGDMAGELAVLDAASYSVERRGNKEWEHNTVHGAAGRSGRVLALQPSPFFQDVLLAVGDCGFAVWRMQRRSSNSNGGGSGSSGAEGVEAGSTAEGGQGQGGGAAGREAFVPIFESRFPEALYSSGCWSPSKPGVIILGRQDGRLEAWDLLDRTHEPCMVAPVAPCALTTLAVSPLVGGSSSRAAAVAPQVLAVGDAAGTLRLLELPRALRRRGHAEAKAVAALLGREQARAAAVAARLEVLAAQQRAAQAAAQAAARKAQQEAAAGTKDGDQAEAAKVAAAAAEQRYLALEAEWRSRLLGPGAGAVSAGADTA